MAVTLHVERQRWQAHIAATWKAYPQLVAVIKGNGYGFGRACLADLAAEHGGAEVAVGTLAELASPPMPGERALRVMVLTPALAHELDPRPDAVLTVASQRHVEELRAARYRGAVVVELATPLGRFGVARAELAGLLSTLAGAGLELHGFGLHFPLVTSSSENVRAVEASLPDLGPTSTVYLSHVGAEDLATLGSRHPDVHFRPRIGTQLWLGDKAALRLRADTLERRRVSAGERVGYRSSAVPADGHVVVVAGGTAHGIHPLPDGRSPFHFARTRLALVEPPHMHTSLLFVPFGDPLPEVGDELDLQRPMTQTLVDRIVEHDSVGSS